MSAEWKMQPRRRQPGLFLRQCLSHPLIAPDLLNEIVRLFQADADPIRPVRLATTAIKSFGSTGLGTWT